MIEPQDIPPDDEPHTPFKVVWIEASEIVAGFETDAERVEWLAKHRRLDRSYAPWRRGEPWPSKAGS